MVGSGEGSRRGSSTRSGGLVRDGLFWEFGSQIDHLAVRQPMSGIGRPVYYYQLYCVLVVFVVSMMKHKEINIRKEKKILVKKVKKLGQNG